VIVTIYGTSSCGACISAMELCKKKGVKFSYKDIGISKYYIELQEHLVGTDIEMTKIPHIMVDKRYIGCYNRLKEFFWELV